MNLKSNLIIKPENMDDFLRPSEIVDFENNIIKNKASKLTKNVKNPVKKTKILYEFVRDEINHTMDIKADKVTFRASDVLKEGHGLCFAKSNLLAALLRCENIPAGFCYQKLLDGHGMILHGLNGLYINEKWIRLDARGNNIQVNAKFSINEEYLAFNPQNEHGEKNYKYIYSKPCNLIINAFENNFEVDDVLENIKCHGLNK